MTIALTVALVALVLWWVCTDRFFGGITDWAERGARRAGGHSFSQRIAGVTVDVERCDHAMPWHIESGGVEALAVRPTGVEVHRTDGTTIPCELEYAGRDHGIHRWKAVTPVMPGDRIRVAVLPAGARISVPLHTTPREPE